PQRRTAIGGPAAHHRDRHRPHPTENAHGHFDRLSQSRVARIAERLLARDCSPRQTRRVRLRPSCLRRRGAYRRRRRRGRPDATGADQARQGARGGRLRLRVIAWACVASAATSLACAIASGYAALLVARLAAGATAAAVIPLAIAWI